MTSKSLIFFGSGPVAAETLAGLLDAGFHFEAVITKPRLAHHRGSVPVLELAQEHDMAIFTPQTKAELSALFSQHRFAAPAGLVVDYGIIIAQDVIDRFAMGIVNSHFSLLPEWRGADPITFSLLSGQAASGVSLMVINAALDEGDLLAQETLPISPQATIDQLTHQLVQLSNKMICHHLPKYLVGEITPYPQPDTPPSYSRKLTKDDSIVDWTKPAEQLEREVRAFLGWPKSRAEIFGQQVILLKTRLVQTTPKTPEASDQTDAATPKTPSASSLVVPCGDNTALEILELIGPSGKRMSGEAFMRGYKK